MIFLTNKSRRQNAKITLGMRIKDEIFSFAHLRGCHNGWASNILIVVDTGIHHSDGSAFKRLSAYTNLKARHCLYAPGTYLQCPGQNVLCVLFIKPSSCMRYFFFCDDFAEIAIYAVFTFKAFLSRNIHFVKQNFYLNI